LNTSFIADTMNNVTSTLTLLLGSILLAFSVSFSIGVFLGLEMRAAGVPVSRSPGWQGIWIDAIEKPARSSVCTVCVHLRTGFAPGRGGP
jgi:hypothetical protein